jgi:hypothetical protein
MVGWSAGGGATPGDLAAKLSTADATNLELAAAEMASAAAQFVALEKEMEALQAKKADSGVISVKEAAR